MSAVGASETPPTTTRLALEVVAGNAAGTMIGVEERLVFGRQSEGPGQLADDPELSRHHAQISRRPTGEYVLEDLSSTNGTYLDGTRLEEPIVLALGGVIELGTSKLVVIALPALAAPVSAVALEAVDVRAATVVVDVPAGVRATTQEQEVPTPPPLELRLSVDLEAAEVEIALEQGPSIRLHVQDGCWQILDGESP